MPRCPSCSAELAASDRFCGACGAEYHADAPTPTRTSVGPSSSHDFRNQARFTTGALLAGRYRIVGLLGRGGMGEVYRADDLKLGQTVALKFLPASMEQDGTRLSRLLNEVRLARQVSHPNVCRVYDIDEVDGSHFMAMEYVDGEDLASLLRRIGRLPQEKALEITRQICAGLAAAHEQGILHRDLKPANVMIDGRGRVKLADFGLAGLAVHLQGDEARAGTPAYMAPEQLAGREVTQRSDIYALGLVLYEIFTGKRAFGGQSPEEIARLQEQTMPTRLSSLVTNVDDIVEQVILRCLEKEPGARPASALAVSAALPGGDPLAAALAAGETPSPEMVADGGSVGGLKPAVAVGALAAVVLTVVLTFFNTQQQTLYPLLPADTPPGELASRAVGILADLGVPEPGIHRRYGFSAYRDYLGWLERNGDSDRLDRLRAERPPGARFWFRYSPVEMIPDDPHAFVLTPDDPGMDTPGQGRLWLDLQGRLLAMEALTPRNIENPREPVDWTAMFTAAGLDPAAFIATDPVRAPTSPGDELRAWRGPVFGDMEGVVQAGRLAGTPTYFEILGPWDLEESALEDAGPSGLLPGLIILGVLVSAVILARRNLLAGRSDRKGALKVMVFFVLTIWITWILAEVRLGTLAAGSLFQEIAFGRLLGHGLIHATLVGLLYIALEPYVRRLWPETLVSWSRLLMGRYRDPLVGRDLLVGMAAIGFLANVLAWIGGQLMRMSGIPVPLGSLDVGMAFDGVRYSLASFLIGPENAVTASMMLLVMLLLLRLLLRRNWAAVGGLLVVILAIGLTGGRPESLPTWFWILQNLGFVTIVAVTIACMLRFGLLSVIGGLLLTYSLANVPLTWDFSSWYAGAGLVPVVGVLALALWAFSTSLAGRRLWGDSVLD